MKKPLLAIFVSTAILAGYIDYANYPVTHTSPAYSPVQFQSVLAHAPKTVGLMTLPVNADPTVCFPQNYVTVRVQSGKVLMDDLQFYPQRRAWISDGLVAFRDGTRSGFIDTAGNVVIPPRFDGVGPFSSGVAVVNSAGKYGYIHPDGSWLRKPDLDWAYDFQHGYAAANDHGTWGILNPDGTWRKKPVTLVSQVSSDKIDDELNQP